MSDDEKLVDLRIPESNLATVLLLVVVGTLDEIRAGRWHPGAGIWAFSRPVFLAELREREQLSAEALAVLGHCDELDAIEERLPGKLGSKIDQMLEVLRAELYRQRNLDYRIELPDPTDRA